jgi:hypothetical protein
LRKQDGIGERTTNTVPAPLRDETPSHCMKLHCWRERRSLRHIGPASMAVAKPVCHGLE